MAEKSLVSQYDGTTVKVGDRFRRYDKGAVVPPEADADHVKVLVERGMLAEGKPAGGATGVDPDAPPPFPLPKEANQPDKGKRGGQQNPPAADENEPPAGNASLEDWRTYALAQDGVTEESIEGLGRDDLRDKFGPKQ